MSLGLDPFSEGPHAPLQERPMSDVWDPERYERFRAERAQPFRDLLALVERRPAMRVVDLGCGTGDVTGDLHRELEARETVGIDSSQAMLARAAAVPGLRFERGDIAEFAPPELFDLVFSNAALHWLPDNASLLRRLTAALGRVRETARHARAGAVRGVAAPARVRATERAPANLSAPPAGARGRDRVGARRAAHRLSEAARAARLAAVLRALLRDAPS